MLYFIIQNLKNIQDALAIVEKAYVPHKVYIETMMLSEIQLSELLLQITELDHEPCYINFNCLKFRYPIN